MNCLIALTLAVAAHAHSYGNQDTPAVSAAKAAHFYEYAKIADQKGITQIPEVYRGYYYPHGNQDTPAVSAADAAHFYEYAKIAAQKGDSIPEVYKGYYYPHGNQDTPAVSAAKATHFYDYAKIAAQHGDSIPEVYRGYYYPDGYLVDTPEVAAARAVFRAANPYAQYRHYNYRPEYRDYYNYY